MLTQGPFLIVNTENSLVYYLFRYTDEAIEERLTLYRQELNQKAEEAEKTKNWQWLDVLDDSGRPM